MKKDTQGKIKKYTTKKKIVTGLLKTGLALLMLAAVTFDVSIVNDLNEFQSDESNDIFKQSKVVENIDYYGGDMRYIDTNFNLFNVFTKEKTVYCSHLYTDGKPIVVGYDAKTVSKEYATQFDYTFDHLNYLFNVINSDYKFVTGFYEKSKCDIYVDLKEINNDYKKIGAYVERKFDIKNRAIIKSATIHFNKNLKYGSPELRYYMLHEMMHVLYGSNDVDYRTSPTFSVYNYNDVSYMVRQICCAYESLEDYKNHLHNCVGYHQEGDCGSFINSRYYYPLMTREQKNSFVSMLPTDVSTLISIYGDSSTIENRKKYLDLLEEVLNANKAIFDVNFGKYKEPANYDNVSEQPYFKEDFELPEL